MSLKNQNYDKNYTLNLSLIFISGMIECYTYLSYGIFASAQTGNLIFFILALKKQQWELEKKILVVCACFIVGNTLATWAKNYFKKKWLPLCVLYVETCIFCFFTFLPPSILKLAVIAFIDTFQICFFNTLKGYTYNSFFITGDLKQLATAIANYLCEPAKINRQKMVFLGFIPFFFSLGVFCYLQFYPLAKDCLTIFFFLSIVTIKSTFSYLTYLKKNK